MLILLGKKKKIKSIYIPVLGAMQFGDGGLLCSSWSQQFRGNLAHQDAVSQEEIGKFLQMLQFDFQNMPSFIR